MSDEKKKEENQDRKIEFDVEAVLLSAACVFMWLSLVSYDPADSIGPIPEFLQRGGSRRYCCLPHE